jgi:hypothetical protein
MLTALLFLAQALPGTQLLSPIPDPAAHMLDGLHAYADARLQSAPSRRAQRPASREKLSELIGAIDPRVPASDFIRHGDGVQWPVVEGVTAEGTIVEAKGSPRCYQIALHFQAVDPACLNVRPVLLSNSTTHTGNPRLGKPAVQPQREFIYRMAYPMGRHPLGYEVQTILSAVDIVAKRQPKLPIRVTGVLDSALPAFLACALDPRIDECTVVNQRFDLADLSKLPVEYNLWRWSEHFDREKLAELVRPRKLNLVDWHLVAPSRPADEERSLRVYQQWVNYTQRIIRETTWQRPAWFAKLSKDQARAELAGVFGEFPEPLMPVAAETRQRYDEPAYTGYEVRIPVAGTVEAYGHLLIPKGMQPGERRALVVTQHGLEGRPEDTILKEKTRIVYDEFARKLVEQGYIVYSPQNPYIHGERFRNLQRKSNPLGLSLFSYINAQHRQTLNWLEELPFVDPARIGYYGLSYGGVTALRVPPFEPRYKVVICSGNFNEWTWKITSIEDGFSFMFTKEYEAFDWNLAPRFGHAEMAALIAPRPFLVERGHSDGVGIDEWVAYEFAKAKRYYHEAGVPDLAEITYFDGPHRIHGEYAYTFMRKHLGPPLTEVRK